MKCAQVNCISTRAIGDIFCRDCRHAQRQWLNTAIKFFQLGRTKRVGPLSADTRPDSQGEARPRG